jgi:hypothetical protein
VTRIPKKVSDALKARAEMRCERCQIEVGTNHHHRRNQSQGGQHTLSNLMWLCGSGTTGCHGFVTRNPALSYGAGWSIRGQVRSPAEVPVLRRGEWVLLDDAGEYIRIPTPAGKAG